MISEKTRQKMRIAKLGKPHTEETKAKMKGRIPWNKGKKCPEIKKHLARFQFKKGFIPWNKDKSGLQVAWNKGKKHIAIIGERNPNWKGGVTSINEKIRKSLEYKLWRTAVFERDNYTCIWCGARSGKGKVVYLEADHIKPFSLYPELRFAIDNGRTLCRECHKTTDTYMVKSSPQVLNKRIK